MSAFQGSPAWPEPKALLDLKGKQAFQDSRGSRGLRETRDGPGRPAPKETPAGRGAQAYQVCPVSEASAGCTACQAAKASRDPQVQTSMGTWDSQVLLGTGVTQERPTPFQAPREPQDRRASVESQGSEARSGVLAFRAFQASPLLPTSLGHQGTSARLGFSAWKVIEGPRGHPGLQLFPEAKAMRGVQEPPETPGPKDGSGTPGPRAGLACSDSREKKGPEGSQDSWAT